MLAVLLLFAGSHVGARSRASVRALVRPARGGSTVSPSWARVGVSMKEDAPGAVELVLGKAFPRGKRVTYGLFTVDADPSALPSEEERARLRAEASDELAVIDSAERARRMLAGSVGSAATAVLAFGLLLTHAPLAARAALVLPVFLSLGFVDSAKTGAWDVDGTGIQPIADKQLAKRMLERVNEFNQAGAITSLAITAAYVLLSEIAAQLLGLGN
ncbi:hypothetical protein T492DRAFT_903832 [Pavlovales sp. CCMP2436]|nr:hypothetical protein T492DRAFT_903832 [Pavlovales sp. CCMP2436]